jgi:hypothetical protein
VDQDGTKGQTHGRAGGVRRIQPGFEETHDPHPEDCPDSNWQAR